MYCRPLELTLRLNHGRPTFLVRAAGVGGLALACRNITLRYCLVRRRPHQAGHLQGRPVIWPEMLLPVVLVPGSRSLGWSCPGGSDGAMLAWRHYFAWGSNSTRAGRRRVCRRRETMPELPGYEFSHVLQLVIWRDKAGAPIKGRAV